MIKSIRDDETKLIWEGVRLRRYPTDIQGVARRKLRMLNNAQSISDLSIPPANRLEQLKKGNKKGQYSIRINDQWRICFVWREGSVYDVEIVDYH